MNRTHVTAIAACAFVLATALPASSQGLSSLDRHNISKFDGIYKALEKAQKNLKRYSEASIEKYLGMMESYLAQVSKPGQQTAEFQQRKEQLAAFKKIADETFHPATSAPPPEAPPGLTANDKRRIAHFDRNYDNTKGMRANLGRADERNLRQFLKVLKDCLDKVSPGGQKDPEYAKRLEQYQTFERLVDDAFDKSALQPRDKLFLDRFDEAYKEWQSIPQSPFHIAEDKARPTVTDLKASLDKVSAHGQERSEYKERLARWTAYAKAIEDAYGPDGPLSPRDQASLADFDRLLARHQAMLASPKAHGHLALRLALEELSDSLQRVSAYGKKKREVQSRRDKLDRATASADDAFGKIAEIGYADRERLVGFKFQCRRTESALAEYGPIDLQDAAARERCEKLLRQLREYLDPIQARNTLMFLRAEERLAGIRAEYDRAVAMGAALAKEGGDIDAQLALVQIQFPQGKWGAKLATPYTVAHVRAWGRRLRNWHGAVDDALAFFAKAEKTSIRARSREFQEYVSWFRRTIRSEIENAVHAKRTDWLHGLEAVLATKQRYDKNPEALSSAGGVKEDLAAVDRAAQNVGFALALSEAYEGKPAAHLVAAAKTLEETRAALQGGYAETVKTHRMPKPDVEQSGSLLEIAGGVLKEEGIAGRRLLVISPKERAREIWWSGARWVLSDAESFWVNFAEKHEGKWWLCSAQLVFYHRGNTGSDPLGKWFGRVHHRHYEILEENIDK